MTLHIFNPEHDIALAANLSNFTAPHAGRQLRSDLAFLPALWARAGDAVLVEHAPSAEKAYRRICHRLERLGLRQDSLTGNPEFPYWVQSIPLLGISDVQPWGWDRAIRRQLERMGCAESVLPSADALERIRQLSHRRTSARLLPHLRLEGTVGEAFECTTVEQVTDLLHRYGRVVLKAPWSSSGRGVRFCVATRLNDKGEMINDKGEMMNDRGGMMNERWVRNVLTAQGNIMVEPYYNKVKDFGMEFEAMADDTIRYQGLSLFHTVNGAYVGNILATEAAKLDMISCYVSADLLEQVKQRIISTLHLDGYVGPFGIDMMICTMNNVLSTNSAVQHPSFNVQRSTFNVHPCVELNLRRTMGHVALAISPREDDDIRGVMRVIYDGSHYIFKINKL